MKNFVSIIIFCFAFKFGQTQILTENIHTKENIYKINNLKNTINQLLPKENKKLFFDGTILNQFLININNKKHSIAFVIENITDIKLKSESVESVQKSSIVEIPFLEGQTFFANLKISIKL